MTITIYYGNSLADCVRQGATTEIFEDMFTNVTSMHYPAMWRRVPDGSKIVCKTSDSIRCAPQGTKLIRVGHSIRNSDRGEIISTEVPIEVYCMLEEVSQIKELK